MSLACVLQHSTIALRLRLRLPRRRRRLPARVRWEAVLASGLRAVCVHELTVRVRSAAVAAAAVECARVCLCARGLRSAAIRLSLAVWRRRRDRSCVCVCVCVVQAPASPTQAGRGKRLCRARQSCVHECVTAVCGTASSGKMSVVSMGNLQ